jgi:molybdopterin-guanine dinucleotide biosynthesis protein A
MPLLKNVNPTTLVINMSTTFSTILENETTLGAPPWPMTALILCGGKSTRMGRPKAFLPYRGTLMITHIVDLVSKLFSEVLLVTNEPELYDGIKIDTVKDIIPHRGPLGGLLSGLLIASHHRSFVMACDMPFIDTKLITEMVNKGHNSDMLVLMHDKGIEPLIGVYSKDCIISLEESLFSGKTSLSEFASGSNTQVMFCSDLATKNTNLLPPYFDIDTPQDYTTAIMSSSK